jgi:hypothetical protein
MVLDVRDQFGEPAAIGTRLTVERDGYFGTFEGYDTLQLTAWDTGGPGFYDLKVSRPWHRTAMAQRLWVLGNGCEPQELSVVLERLSPSPPVRQVVVFPDRMHFSDGNLTQVMTAFVLRDLDVPGDVAWLSTDTSVVSVSITGVIQTACRTTPGVAWVIASALADPTALDSGLVHVSSYRTDSPRCP